MNVPKRHPTVISPRFAETDAMGHINNSVLPVWFEEGRREIFKAIHPELTFENWPLIVARIEVDFIAQIYVGTDVLIYTGIAKLGNSSITVLQEARQNDGIVARGKTIVVHFDFQINQSKPLSQEMRDRLTPLLIES